MLNRSHDSLSLPSHSSLSLTNHRQHHHHHHHHHNRRRRLPQLPHKNMASADFPLVCQWGGELVEDSEGLHYIGGERCFIIINRSSTFADILNELFQATGLDPRVVQLKIKMECPIPGSYIAMPLQDEKSLLGMWAIIAQISAPSMVIYLEQVPVRPSGAYAHPTVQVQTSAPTCSQQTFRVSSKRRLNNDQSTHDHIEEVTSPHHHQPGSSNHEKRHCGPVRNISVVGTSALTSSSLVRRTSVTLVDEKGANLSNSAPIIPIQSKNWHADNGVDGVHMEESEDEVDLVSLSAPIPFFTQVDKVQPDDSWRTWVPKVDYTPGGEFCVGQVFDDKKQLKAEVNLYSIERNKSFRVVESDRYTWAVECKRKNDLNCTWRLRGSKKDSYFERFTIVKYAGPHSATCVGESGSKDHCHLTSEFISGEIRDLVRRDPSLKVRDIVQLMKERFGYTVTYKKAWQARKNAVSDVSGNKDSKHALSA